MQIIYFTIFMTTLIAYVVLGLSPAEEQFKRDRDIVATHMTAWHKGAIKRCSTVACSGTVDPTSYMFSSMTSGSAFSKSRFTTKYDTASKLLITSVNKSVDDAGISYAVVMSGLNEMTNGESSSIGVFNRSASRVDFTSLTGIYKKTYVTIPSALATGIADGSPVIVTNM